MKKKYVLTSILACLIFASGFFLSRVIDILNNEDLIEYFHDYGETVLIVNNILDKSDIDSVQVKEKINRELLEMLFCSPMFYYLPKVAEKSAEQLQTFWNGYYQAFQSANLNEKEITKNDFDCSKEKRGKNGEEKAGGKSGDTHRI